MTMLDALAAAGAAPDRGAKMMLFGQFVGSWDLDVDTLDPDGTWRHERGEWHFGWILEGRAIQDVWITPARSLRPAAGPPVGEYGTAIRLYDPHRDGWRVVWIGPVLGKVRTLDVHEEEDEIVLETVDDRGLPMHWVFSEITERSYRWRSEILEEGGWRVVQRMRAHRRTADV